MSGSDVVVVVVVVVVLLQEIPFRIRVELCPPSNGRGNGQSCRISSSV